jgi:hypothetical protein
MSIYDAQPHGKPILCLDFDGVIHSYKSGWKGVEVIPDPPVPGVFEWITEALKDFEIHIYSSRSRELKGRVAMMNYVQKHAGAGMVKKLQFSGTKPRAYLTIDDRCICFKGDWSDPQLHPGILKEFIPWYRYKK